MPRSGTRRPKAGGRAPTFDDRVEVYVDSPLMTHRVRLGRRLFARIQGSYGIYRTWVRSGSRGLDSGCTCPSEWWPCKHVAALDRTWRANPRSFFDADRLLEKLASRPKTELVKTIGRLIARSPEALAALGVKGFEEEGEAEER
jgi:hypothetical protein